MGITVHFSANDVKEKTIDDIAEYWKKEIGKAKESLPKEFFPDSGFKILKDDKEEARMFNAVYGTPTIEMATGKPIGKTLPKADICRGIVIYPHIGSEEISFAPCRTKEGWFLRAFTKTQYGGIPAHLIVCKILEDTKRMFLPNLSIRDEADYCGETGTHDKKTLIESFEESAIMIDKIGEMLKGMGFKEEQIVTGGEIAIKERKKLEEVV